MIMNCDRTDEGRSLADALMTPVRVHHDSAEVVADRPGVRQQARA
jgi:hypothetical protein